MSASNSKNTDAIVNAALELFKRDGYVNVSVSDICRAARVPRSSFYSIFAGKEEIITYLLKNLKNDYENVFAEFLNAKNDLDRIWFLYERYLSLAMEFGPDLTGTLFSIELQKSVGVFESFVSINDWFTKLVRNCQDSGLIRNKMRAEDIVTLGIRLAVGAAYEWCLKDGSFDLHETAVRELELLYDVPDEHKKSKD